MKRVSLDDEIICKVRTIDSLNFSLTIKPQLFVDDDSCILNISVVSDDFSAQASLDVFKNDYSSFIYDTINMYEKLRGNASIKENYGDEQYIKFSMDETTGHIHVNGCLSSQGKNDHLQEMTFENEFDQTCLKFF